MRDARRELKRYWPLVTFATGWLFLAVGSPTTQTQNPPTPDFLDGPAVAAFDTSKDSCEQIDIPDAAARAFRDYKGTIHLIASHHVTRAGLGPTLETVKHNCQVVYQSAHDGNIADFNDNTWLNSFYNVDGRRIVALGHMEYHGWEHGQCAGKTDTAACWYNVETFNLSEDGGCHFARPKPPANYLLSLPYKYLVNQGPEGVSIDANIVKVGDWYYTAMNGWPWPPNCGTGKGDKACLNPGGTCPIRTSNILDSSSWRGWDGAGFNVTFADPYRGPITNPQSHVCSGTEYRVLDRLQLLPGNASIYRDTVYSSGDSIRPSGSLLHDITGLCALEQAGAGIDYEPVAPPRT